MPQLVQRDSPSSPTPGERSGVDLVRRDADGKFNDKVFFHAYDALGAQEAPKPNRWKIVAWGAGLSVLAAAALLVFHPTTKAPEPAKPVPAITVAPLGADVQIGWTGGSRHSEISTMKVQDGERYLEVNLAPKYEASGTMVYHPRTPRLDITWTVEERGQTLRTNTTYIVAQAPVTPVAPPPVARVSSGSGKQMERLRTHNRRMEALVKALRARKP